MRTRREVLGDEHVDRAVASTTDFTAPFQDFITRYAWGELWNRPGLTRPERSMITLAILAALGRDEELVLHLRAALRNGLSPEEIREVLMQVAVYAGVPGRQPSLRPRRRDHPGPFVVRTAVHWAAFSGYRSGCRERRRSIEMTSDPPASRGGL